MKKEWVLLVATTVATLIIALLVIRWLAPGLLGIPVDLQMVRVEKKLPPFFEGVFREEDQKSDLFILKDPISNIRAHPLIYEQGIIGPHDILGFRNRSVPNIADLITIGDSQTYGVNVPLDFNWPSTTRKILRDKLLTLYNMSVGGWSALQYYYIFKHALYLNPRAVVVAFYTGNDPTESFTLAYGSETWSEFRVDPSLHKSDAPKAEFPPPPDDEWKVTFRDGITTVFAPKLRLTSNLEVPAVKAGYTILAKAAEQMSSIAKPFNIPVAFTIIPTKELVYAEKVRIENIDAPQEYIELVRNEKKYINWLRDKILSLPNTIYIDTLSPLQQQALFPTKLYPENVNGHPISDGYYHIGSTIAKQLDPLFQSLPNGLVYRNKAAGHKPEILFIGHRKYWIFSSPEIAAGNGWDLRKNYPLVSDRDIAGFEYMGIINRMDTGTFGPQDDS